MASHALTVRFRRPMMAWSALFKAELLALSRSWVLRGWLIALALSEFFMLTGTLMQARVAPVPGSQVLAAHLDGFLLVWSIFIIVLGAGSVSTEQEVISDSILSRACTRTQYIAAKLASRALAVLGVYLLSSAAAGYAAWRYAAADMTLATIGQGLLVVGLAVLLLLSLGILVSVVFNNTVVAVASMILLWYVASPIFSFTGAEYLSPASLVRNLPRILKDPAAPQLVQGTATQTGMTLVFSKRLDAAHAEEPGNYLLEGEDGQTYAARTAIYDRAKTSVTLGGLDLPAGETLKVTARGVTDAGGSALSPAADNVSVKVPAAKDAEKPDAKKPDADAPDVDKPSGQTAPAASTAKPKAAKPAAGRRDTVAPRVVQCSATASSVKVVFSEEMDPEDAETVKNYIVENPPGATHVPAAATYGPGTRSVLLSGLKLSLDDPVKVTVKDAGDRQGNPVASRGNSATYTEVTVWKYVLGFGVPALLFALLATAWFSRRDL